MIIRSFRLRLAVTYATVVVVIISAFFIVLDLQFRRDLLETVDKDLLRAAKTELVQRFDPRLFSGSEEVAKRFQGESYDFVNREGVLFMPKVARQHHWSLNKDLLSTAFKGFHQFETVETDGVKYRLLYFPVTADYILRIGEPLEDMQRAISSLETLLIILFPCMFFFLVFASWLLAGKSVEPLIRMKSLSREIRHGGLERRMDIGLKGREIDGLIAMFNDMLDSIQRSIEVQKRFTSDVSHEIRSPLTSLRGSIEVMLKKRRTPEEYEELLENNLSDIIRLSKITESMLFLSRADNDTVELRRKRVDVNEILRNIVEATSFEGLSLVEQFHDNVGIDGDSVLLERAFSNLIGNAIKYTPRGGTVTIMTAREGDSVKITIRDTGIGISEEKTPYIFDRFYRVDKERSRKSGGTGLGLAIAHWIINAHKGKIMVKSEAGKGSDFVVVFPVTANHEDPAGQEGQKV